jgi:hypothetical protein
MTDSKKYTGGCHCGKVRFEVEADLSAPVIECNCSMCGKSGTRLSFVPAAQFNLLQGDDRLTDYLFAKQHIHHLFCNVCGIKPFARGAAPDGSEMIAVNTRCLDEIDLAAQTIQHFDGKSL